MKITRPLILLLSIVFIFPQCGISQTISAGESHSIVVCADGQVQVFGSNDYGQLGLGENIESPTPSYLPGMTDVVAAAACGDHSLFVKADGTVWATGDNDYGELGDGTTNTSFVPVQAQGVTNAVAVSGIYQSLVLLSDGTVMAFGENGSGQCGVGFEGDVHTPTLIPGLNNVIAISAGYYYSLALKADGTVWAWGSNAGGKLGIGLDVATSVNAPVQIESLSNIVAIDAGGAISMALDNNGQVWVWGVNTMGQLGTGDNLDHATPIIHPLLSNIVAISCGEMFGVAIDADGHTKSWGRNWVGQLGVGNTDDQPTPVDVVGLSDITGIYAGHDAHTLFLKNDGSLWASGFGTGGVGQAEFSIISTPIVVENICTTSNEVQSEETTMEVYPNPFENTLRIESENASLNYSVYNSCGQLLQNGLSNSCVQNIDTSAWPAGVYMLHIHDGESSEFRKLIKQ